MKKSALPYLSLVLLVLSAGALAQTPIPTPTPTFPIVGNLYPKFLVVGVTYAPPGAGSSVSYTDTTMIGTSTSLTNSFTNSTSTSLSVTSTLTIPSVITDMNTSTVSTMFTQMEDTTASVAVNETKSVLTTVNGAGQALDHDQDQILVWLNPVLEFKMTGPNTIVWKGYGADGRDQSQLPEPMDVRTILVGQLNGDLPAITETSDPELFAALQRAWADEPTDGSGNALTAADFKKILAADPFSNPLYTVDIPPGSNCTLDHRFCINKSIGGSDSTFPFEPGEGATTLTVTHQKTDTAGQGASLSSQVSFSVDNSLSGGLLGSNIKIDLKNSEALTSTTQWATTSTQQTGQTLAVKLQPPPLGNYDGPITFELLQDSLYGSYAFDSLLVATFSLSASPSLEAIPAAGGCVDYTVTTDNFAGSNETIALSLTGLPAGVTASFSPASIAGSGSSTVSVCAPASSPAAGNGPYTLGITGTTGSPLSSTNLLGLEAHSVTVTLKVKA